MALTTYKVFIEDTATGAGCTGLTLSWSNLYYETGEAVISAAQPAITAIGGGWYKFSWDAIANGEAFGTIDAGAPVSPITRNRYKSYHIAVPAEERADLAVQLLHNARSGPSEGVGVESVMNRDGTAVMANYTRANNGTTQTRVPTGQL